MTTYKADINKKNVKKKAEKVKEILQGIKQYKTIALIDLTKLPDSLLQSIRRKIREKAGKVIVLKKPVIERILEHQKLEKMKEYCNRAVALILTNSSPYELNKFFRENKKKRAAKVGEKAPFEIIVPAGDTDLPAGPALSELKAAGVSVQLKAGKIAVSKDSVIVKSGDEITAPKVKALQQLGVMPFETSVNLIFGYDGDLYQKEILDIDLDLENGLKSSYVDAFNLSINAKYPTEGNIEFILKDAFVQSTNLALNAKIYSSVSIEQLLASAQMQGMALDKIVPKEGSETSKEQNEEKNTN